MYISKEIGRRLRTNQRTFIEEEIFNMIKYFKSPTINFRYLNKLYVDKVKEMIGL